MPALMLRDGGAAKGSPPAGDPLGPVSPSRRIEVLDILRGWALFGVFVCNMRWFSGAWEPTTLWSGSVDRLATLLVDYAADDKFYTLFSFLFGIGFALQLSRARARGVPFVGIYVRRLIVLLAIGLVHTYIAWWNEALHVYALLGFVLLLFPARSNRVLLGTAAALVILVPGLYRAVEFGTPEDPETAAAEFRGFMQAGSEHIAQEGAYVWHTTRASAAVWATYRARGWVRGGVTYHTDPYYAFMWFPSIVGLFLLGQYVGRRRMHEHLLSHVRLIRRTMWCGLAVGLPCTLATLVLRMTGGAVPGLVPGVAWILTAEIAWVVGAPALMLFQAALITLLAQRRRWHRVLAPLAAAGRTALTGYVAQSVVAVLVFYGFGLGWKGHVGPAALLALTGVIFAMQVMVSNWWLDRFRFGPLEWLWRTLTYMRIQPLRVPPVEVPAPIPA